MRAQTLLADALRSPHAKVTSPGPEPAVLTSYRAGLEGGGAHLGAPSARPFRNWNSASGPDRTFFRPVKLEVLASYLGQSQ